MGSSQTRMDRDRERDLVDRARSDAAAFAELYDFYLPRIYGFVHRRVGERSVAEDLTSATFQRALEALRHERLRNDAFGGWLYRVAANAVTDHYRAQRHHASGTDTDALASAASLPGPARDAFAAALDRDELRRAMAALPERHRTVLNLRFYDDLDPDEAATLLGCSRGTFAVRLHRALAALRAAIETPALVPAATTRETSDAA
jgi:RNA polymerase sigma-70 factor (ECF subfamily)